MPHVIRASACLFLLLALSACLNPSASSGTEAAGIRTYSAIPGIEPSTRFSARVNDGRNWHELFTMETIGPQKAETGVYSRGIYEPVTGLSASWCTFEMDVPVTVEITKLSPGEIVTCVIRPLSRGLTPVISEDRRSVRFRIEPRFAEEATTADKQVPVNVAIEINGQTEEMMTVFASPHLADKPRPDEPGVFMVEPGSPPPVDGEWDTLYFMPGVHDLGKKAHPLRPGKRYYIPGDAWVDGGFGEGHDNLAEGAKIFGLGVISGRRIGWHEVEQRTADKLLHLFGPDTVLEGITFIDSPHHTWMAGSKDPERPTIIRNIKCHSWRQNTDGLHIFGSGIAEDVFFHAQDDGHYVASTADRVRFRRWVYWRDDSFGADIIFTAGGSQWTPGDSITEDGDSIYNKSTWKGVIIDQRGLRKKGNWVDGVTIRDFRIENPGANQPIIKMYLPEHPCTFRNVLLKNITSLRDNGHPFKLTGGGPDAVIENVTFEDIRLGERWIEDFSPENFTLAFVRNLKIVRDGETMATYSSDIEADAGQIRPDPANLLTNPGFEIAGFKWDGQQVGADAVPAHEGRFAYRVAGNFDSPNRIRQSVTRPVIQQGGRRYRVSAWVRISDGDGRATVTLQCGQVNRDNGARTVEEASLVPVPLAVGTWVQVAGELTLPWNSETYDWLRWVNFDVQASGTFGQLFVDDCRLECIEACVGLPSDIEE